MAKDWFSIDRIAPLSRVPQGEKIHVIGVCGVAMAQLAVVLAEQGFHVSGSDKEFYEPMGSFLRSSSVKLCEGYRAENVPFDAALVVIGNAVSYGHPEVSVIEERQLPYTLFPALLADLAIADRHSIVVSGTHGKTTTSAMIAVALAHLGAEPSFFVGGAVPGFSSGLVLGKGKFSVVEGDEYDSCFFAKVPKFSFYRPQSLIVNAIEFDHADIYPDLAAIDREFERLVLSVPPGGRVVMYGDGAHERELLKRWGPRLQAQLVSFGKSSTNEFVVSTTAVSSETNNGECQRVVVQRSSTPYCSFSLSVPGEHNARNAAAAAIVLIEAGFAPQAVGAALARFGGVRRRQEVRLQTADGLVIIDDFAHHPTAVRETLGAIRQRYPKHRVIAVFEPRSATSRRKVFQDAYINAFALADKVILCLPQARGTDTAAGLLDVSELAQQITQKCSVPAVALADAQAICAALTKEISPLPAATVTLVMSNGGFGGLIDNLLKQLVK